MCGKHKKRLTAECGKESLYRMAVSRMERSMRYLFTDHWEFAKLPFGTGLDEAYAQGDFHPVRIPHDWLIGQTEDLYETASGWSLSVIAIT